MQPSIDQTGNHPGFRRVLLWVVAGLIAGGAARVEALDFPSLPSLFKRNTDSLEEMAQAPCGPGDMTMLPSGDYIISCHQFYNPAYAVTRLNRDGIWEPFPNAEMNTRGTGNPLALDAVLGLKCDPKGIVWMLDNGRLGGAPPKLVAWDTNKGKTGELHRTIPLVAPAVLKTSFLRGLALDPNEPFIYISDPASGPDAAIIVVDLRTGLSRRVLQGHFSVVPEENVGLQLDGKLVEARGADGNMARPLAGVGPVEIDRKGNWLYFGPMYGNTLYRVETEYLRNPNLGSGVLNSKVGGFSQKPICDSMALDSKGNFYFGDIQSGAIGYVTPDDKYGGYHHLVLDGRLVWPGGLTLGSDGQIHLFSNQLHRTPIFNSGKNATVPPFEIFRTKALTSRFWPR
ncbi:MAG: hypothetical protein KDM91_20545 [Verrucomicrobiae bacterium]|nr:hypothetical protein [Verrucomicrobiae bacterium]MCP5540726.1 hypothetical protein [Akkermansiaceae bacterium]